MVNKKYIISFILITIFIFSTISIVSAQNTDDLSHNPVNLSDESVSILKINNSNNDINNTNNVSKNTQTIKTNTSSNKTQLIITNTSTNKTEKLIKNTTTNKIDNNSELKLNKKELENLGLRYKIGIKEEQQDRYGKIYKILDLSTNKTYRVLNINIESNNHLKYVLDAFKKDGYYNTKRLDLIRINLNKTQKYQLEYEYLPLYNKLSNLEINGNGATIEEIPSKPIYYLVKKVVDINLIDNSQKMYINNLKLKNFDVCIKNTGYLKLNNVSFESNTRAIDNYGKLSCISCLFKNNDKTNGASIYNRENSYAECLNCSFISKNSKIKEIYCEKSSFTKIIITNSSLFNKPKYKCDTNGLIAFRNSTIPIVHIENVTTNDTINCINEYSKYDIVILNFKNQTYRFKNFSFEGLVEKIIINGNGATFKGYHPKINISRKFLCDIFLNQYRDDSDENYNNLEDDKHFAIVKPNHYLIIYNATLKYYNQAIINNGNFRAENVIFDSNKVKYFFKKDYGGAIYNKEGEIECINCTFINNSGKYAGAIYNDENAFARIIDCKFYNNSYYNEENIDIYNMNNESLEFIITTNNTNDTDNHTGVIIKNYKGFSKIEYMTVSIAIGLEMGFLIPGVSIGLQELMPFLGETIAEIIGTTIVSSVSSAIVSSIHGLMNHDLSLNGVLTSSIIGGCLSLVDLKLSSSVMGELGYEAIATKLGTNWSKDDTWDLIEIVVYGALDSALF